MKSEICFASRCRIIDLKQVASRTYETRPGILGKGMAATVTFDRFRVVQLANAALEEGRRAGLRGPSLP